MAAGVVVAAWTVVLVHNAATALRDGTASVLRIGGAASYAALLVAAGIVLERTTGGAAVPPMLVQAGGLVLVVAGAALHVGTRRVLGARWAAATTPRPGTSLVTDGPYAVVRHPLYAALLAMAAGSVLAHPSVATACAAAGLAAGIAGKIAREERALAAAFGEGWDAYRTRVPALVPGLTRGTRR